MNTPGSLTAGTDHILRISHSSNDLLDLNGVSLVDFTSTILDLDGIKPASSTVPAPWQNPGVIDKGYSDRIALNGATSSTVAPSNEVPDSGGSLTLVIGGVGAVGLGARFKHCQREARTGEA